MIRVAYIGNFKHPHCTEVLVARAFEENGCTVTPVQQDDRLNLSPHASTSGIRLHLDTLRLTGHDLVLYTRTHNRTALAPHWTGLWRELEADGAITASLHLDRFWDLEREHLIHDADPLFTTQHVFTADGANDSRWREAGVNHHWLAPAIDRQEAEYDGRQRRGPRVLFCGSINYHREYPERDELVRFLRARYRRAFVHVGPGGLPVVRGRTLSDLYRSAHVIVGDSCFANSPAPRTNARYWSDRIPETVGRGGFLIHPWVLGLNEQFTTGRHLVTHVPGDFADLAEQIDFYLANAGERAAIAEQGRAHVLAHHTWTHRVRDLLETVGLGEKVESR